MSVLTTLRFFSTKYNYTERTKIIFTFQFNYKYCGLQLINVGIFNYKLQS